MDVNSGSGRRADRPASLLRRRSSLRLVEPEFEPTIEWVDTPEAHVLVADLPGFKNEDVKVQLDAWGNLIISGERCVEEMVHIGGMWHPRQRPGFKFKKVVSIPQNVNTIDITTRFENEMFYITMNKLRPPLETKSTSNILDQEDKSIPQVGESSINFIEESQEKKHVEASRNKPDQNQRDEKVETSEVAKSSATQADKASRNKLVQSPRGEKVETLEVVKFSATKDEKVSSHKNDQSPREEKVETTGVIKSSTTQDEKVSSNKLDQIPIYEKVETPRVAKSSTNEDDKELSNKMDQSPRDEKVETIEVAKFVVAQDDKASSNKPDQSPKDKKVDISKVRKSSVPQLDDEKVETPKVAKSSTSQDEIQMETQLEGSKKPEELAKSPSLLNEEKLVDSNTLPEKFELLDYDPEEVQMSVGDQHEHKLVENPIAKRNFAHQDHIQEMKVSSPKAKKKDDSKGEEDKKIIWKVHPYVSQFISSRHESMVVAAIVVFSLTLYITYTLTYPKD